jgi:intracellular septation protein A
VNHTPLTVDFPCWRVVARQALRQLVENTLAPLAVFYTALVTLGLHWAFVCGMGLWYLTLGYRLVRRQKIPAMLLVGTALVTARGVIGLVTGSAFLYFLQPSLGNFAIGALFLGTVAFGRPLAARLGEEFCAIPKEVTGHHRLRGFFKRVSLLWAFVFCWNGAVAIWMLVSVPVQQYLLISFSSSTTVILLAITVSVWYFRRCMHRAGMQIRLGGRLIGRPVTPPAAPAAIAA